MDRVSFFAVILGMMCNLAAAQNVHIVGDSMGWDIPPNTSVSYSNWASGKTFVVGDILVFNFVTNQHDVVQVPLADYNDCSDDNPIGNIITTGPANITLDSAGDRHYICTFGRHCESGQKLSITVSTPGVAAPPTTTPTPPTTTPSPATPQPDACAPAPANGPTAGTTPPAAATPDSASVSLTVSLLITIMSAVVAFVF